MKWKKEPVELRRGFLLGVFQSGGGVSAGCFREARRPWTRAPTLLERQVSISHLPFSAFSIIVAGSQWRGLEERLEVATSGATAIRAVVVVVTEIPGDQRKAS